MRDEAMRRSTRRADDAESSEAVAGQLSWMTTFPQGRCRIGSSDHFEMVAWCSGVLSTPADVRDGGSVRKRDELHVIPLRTPARILIKNSWMCHTGVLQDPATPLDPVAL
jgi:hypothetical protein